MSRKKRAPKKLRIIDPIYKSEIIPKLINSIMYDGKKTVAEKIVYDAVRTLFNSADELEILNKKAVYLYLREITGLNTKQIVSQLNKMRKRYKNFKSNWDNCKI